MFGINIVLKSATKLPKNSNFRHFSVPTSLYNNVWRKSTILYITYVLSGCIVLEAIYGSVTNFIWESNNKGVSMHASITLNLFL